MTPSTPKTRIAIVAPFPPPYGGMSVLAETLSRCLGRHGFRLVHIDTNRHLSGWLGRNRLLLLLCQTVAFYVRLLKIVRCDVVLFVASSGGSFFGKIVPAALLCRLFRKPVILDFVGGGIEDKLADNAALWKRCFACFHEVIVPTHVFRNLFSSYGIRSVVLPHIVDIERFHHGKRDGSRHVLLAAKNLATYSGIDSILLAYNEVRKKRTDIDLVIAGSGPERERLDRLVTELGLTGVTFVGNVGYADMPKLFADATIFVHGTQYESFGIVLVEAFASGTPVVSTNVGGIPEVVTDGVNGHLVPYGDYRAMAKKIEALLDSPAKYAAFRNQAVEEARKYSCAVLAPSYVELIETVLKGRN